MGIYKNDTVFTGQGDPQSNSYSKMSKKFYLFVVLAETTALCIAYSYFICVTNRYTQNMKGKEEEEEAEKMEEMMAEEKAARKWLLNEQIECHPVAKTKLQTKLFLKNLK